MILSLNINSSFNHLECLVFHSIQPDILISLLPKLVHLPRFFSLTIDTQRTLNDLTDVYRLILDLPKLKYLRFFAMEPETTGVTVSLPIHIDKQFSDIKHLVIDHSCSFNETFSIISYTSQINRLSFIHKKYSTLNIGVISSNILSNLTDISIYGDDITFDEFDIFITKIYSKLKVLSLKSLAKDMNYLNADRWEQLIRKYFPQLEKFYLTFYVFFEYGDGSPKYNGNSNRFNSSFWIERQWVFEAQIDFDKIMYSMHPFRKRWYEMINSSNELSKSMRIVFMTIRYDGTLKQIISHISSVAEIYHLEIYEEVYTDMLIEILDLLPQLNSVQIPSLPYSNSIYMTDKDVELLSPLICKNQITKVYLKKMIKIEEIYFLLKLCPRMTYLKMDSLNNMNIELFLRCILAQIRNYQLQLLCFRVKAADDKIVEKLNKMVYFEKFILDFTIKRIFNEIYLQWK